MVNSPPFSRVPGIHFLTSPRWTDYALLDSGAGWKLERFGAHTFVRPEVQALWTRSLPASEWESAAAVFVPTGEESGGHWSFRRQVPEKWELGYPLPVGTGGGGLRFWVQTTPGRHLGVFPECAAHWDWMAHKLAAGKQGSGRELQVLNLFGYTGLASLACAAAGARVTHVDASRKSVAWARENALLSGLEQKPIRWIVDDALRFVQREARRGARYDGLYLDPPKFGRGPKGEVWELFKSLPGLLAACREVLSDRPLFAVLSVYAVRLPAIHIREALAETLKGLKGGVEGGELVTLEESAGRRLSQAVYARWEAA